MRRLTRIHTRSVEQPVNLDEGDAYDWPWLYAVQVGEWGLSDPQGKLLREYCLRGGFFMADDLHGQAEWYEFESRMKKARERLSKLSPRVRDRVLRRLNQAGARVRVGLQVGFHLTPRQRVEGGQHISDQVLFHTS